MNLLPAHKEEGKPDKKTKTISMKKRKKRGEWVLLGVF